MDITIVKQKIKLWEASCDKLIITTTQWPLRERERDMVEGNWVGLHGMWVSPYVLGVWNWPLKLKVYLKTGPGPYLIVYHHW